MDWDDPALPSWIGSCGVDCTVGILLVIPGRSHAPQIPLESLGCSTNPKGFSMSVVFSVVFQSGDLTGHSWDAWCSTNSLESQGIFHECCSFHGFAQWESCAFLGCSTNPKGCSMGIAFSMVFSTVFQSGIFQDIPGMFCAPQIPRNPWNAAHKSQGILRDLRVVPVFSRVGGAADPDGQRETFHRRFPPAGRAGKIHGDLQGAEGEEPEDFWDSGNELQAHPTAGNSSNSPCSGRSCWKKGISFPLFAWK